MTTDRAAFLRSRKAGIGGSDVAAILGMSRWRTGLEVYLDKIGESPDTKASDRQELGMIMEEPILQKYAEMQGVEIISRNELVVHPELKFLLANLDARVKDANDSWVVDAKNVHWKAAAAWGEDGTDVVPDDIFWQMHHYCYVVGSHRADVAAVIGSDWPPRIYSVFGDTELFELVVDRLADFWHFVESRTPPPPDFAHATTVELMKQMYPDVDPEKEVSLPASYLELLERYYTLGQIETAAKKRRDQAKGELLFALEGAAKGRIDGTDIVLTRSLIKESLVPAYTRDSYVKLGTKFPKNYVHQFGVANAPKLIEGETHG